MKRIILTVGLANLLLATPLWYHNIKEIKPNHYIGYGSGGNESEAKQEALSDIASQIFTKIDTTSTQNKSSSDGKYKNDFEVKSIQNTKANMSDFEVIKGESEDGKYFVALSYENIGNIERFVQKVKTSGEDIPNKPTNSFLQSTPLAQKVSELLGKKLDFEIVRQNQAWFIRYKNGMQHISQSDFEKLFITIANEKLELSLNKKSPILYDGEEFFFQVKSKEDGFVTLFCVYEDGTVSALLKNIPLKKDTLITLPDENSETIPVAGILEVGKPTFDMYVGVWTPKKGSFERFADATDEAIEDEKYKNFGEFIEFLKDKRYSTLKVITKPQQGK